MATQSAKLVGPDGRPIDSGILREPQTAQTAKTGWLMRQFPLHPSRGLTPARLYQTLDMAERGYLREQAELFTDMEEKDTHIFAELQKRKRALLTLDWCIEPPDDATDAEKQEAELAEGLVRGIPNFEDVIVDALDAIGHGFSALEIEWMRAGAATVPKAIAHRPQSWFVMDQATQSKVQLRRADSFQGDDLMPFGWILHIHKAKSGYISRGGLLRVLTLPYLYRNYSARDFAEFLEIYGLPVRLGKYPAGTAEEEKTALLDAVISMGHDAAGIIPDEMALEFLAAADGKGETFMSMIEWTERSISKAILGGTLTSGADGKSSTNALGNVHNEVRHDLKVADARQLESTLTMQLVFPLLALNGTVQPDPRRMPRFLFDTRQPADLKLYADSLPNLVKGGMKIPTAWAHEKLMIPQAKDGEEVLIAPKEPVKDTPPLPADASATGRLMDGKFFAALTAALAKKAKAEPFPDQAALDAAMDAVDPVALNAAMTALLKPLLEKIATAGSEDDVLEALAAVYPQMDGAPLRKLLEQAMFVSEVWGLANGG